MLCNWLHAPRDGVSRVLTTPTQLPFAASPLPPRLKNAQKIKFHL
jgi:hypothetical protein